MEKGTPKRKLTLNKETLRLLNDESLKRAAGGTWTYDQECTFSCSNTVNICCTVED